MDPYIFESERLGFRIWTESDLAFLNVLNSNPLTMQFFPKSPSVKENLAFLTRMMEQYEKFKYCYFLVEELESRSSIGFIGLSYQTYISEYTPAVDIGWRLLPEYWGNGYATEGAKRALKYGLSELKLEKVIAVAPQINHPSIQVMKKIGMTKTVDFKHPLLKDYPHLQNCSLFESYEL